MKVKQLIDVLFDIEFIRICKSDNSIWCGYAASIPKKYYNDDIDKVCSFPKDVSNSCTYIFIK